jgi:hypothetical protein
LRPNEAGSRNGDHLPSYQVGREGRQLIVVAVGPAVFDGDVLALNEARLA